MTYYIIDADFLFLNRVVKIAKLVRFIRYEHSKNVRDIFITTYILGCIKITCQECESIHKHKSFSYFY